MFFILSLLSLILLSLQKQNRSLKHKGLFDTNLIKDHRALQENETPEQCVCFLPTNWTSIMTEMNITTLGDYASVFPPYENNTMIPEWFKSFYDFF